MEYDFGAGYKNSICIHFPDLIESLSKNGMSTGAKHETKDENLRHRAANGSATHSAPEEKNYTPEQVEAVKK